MTVQFIKVTKKDRVCYAPVPEPVEEGDKLEIMEMKEFMTQHFHCIHHFQQ